MLRSEADFKISVSLVLVSWISHTVVPSEVYSHLKSPLMQLKFSIPRYILFLIVAHFVMEPSKKLFSAGGKVAKAHIFKS